LFVEAPAREDVTDGGGAVVDTVDLRVLREVAQPAGAVHHAGKGVGVATQHLQEARLPGAVPTHEAHFVAGADGEADAVHDDGATHLNSELADL